MPFVEKFNKANQITETFMLLYGDYYNIKTVKEQQVGQASFRYVVTRNNRPLPPSHNGERVIKERRRELVRVDPNLERKGKRKCIICKKDPWPNILRCPSCLSKVRDPYI